MLRIGLSWLKQCKQEKFQLLIQNGLAHQVGRSEVLPPGSLKFSMLYILHQRFSTGVAWHSCVPWIPSKCAANFFSSPFFFEKNSHFVNFTNFFRYKCAAQFLLDFSAKKGWEPLYYTHTHTNSFSLSHTNITAFNLSLSSFSPIYILFVLCW